MMFRKPTFTGIQRTLTMWSWTMAGNLPVCWLSIVSLWKRATVVSQKHRTVAMIDGE